MRVDQEQEISVGKKVLESQFAGVNLQSWKCGNHRIPYFEMVFTVLLRLSYMKNLVLQVVMSPTNEK